MAYEDAGGFADFYEMNRDVITGLLDGADELGVYRPPEVSVQLDAAVNDGSFVLPDRPVHPITGMPEIPDLDSVADKMLGREQTITSHLSGDLLAVYGDAGQVRDEMVGFEGRAQTYMAVHEGRVGYAQAPAAVTYTHMLAPGMAMSARNLLVSVQEDDGVRTVELTERMLPDGQPARLSAFRFDGEVGAVDQAEADIPIGRLPQQADLAWCQDLLNDMRSA